MIGVVATFSAAICPVAAPRAWINAAAITERAVFRSVDRHDLGGRLSDRGISEVVKRRAAAAGMDPARFSEHSLRAGSATKAAAVGVPKADIAQQTRHRLLAILRGYVREGNVMVRNPSAHLGL